MDRLKISEVPAAKEVLLEQQNYLCGLCDLDLSKEISRNIVLDHNYSNGQIRSVLCRSCNHAEGMVRGWANRAKRNKTIFEWLIRMMEYIEYHEDYPSGIYHPSYRTENEKRLFRNKKARLRNKKRKEKI